MLLYFLFLFFFNDTATTEIYTLSLHDALPISVVCRPGQGRIPGGLAYRHGPERGRCRALRAPGVWDLPQVWRVRLGRMKRSEEHTSELQSQSNLVCRLLLEKKKRAYHSAVPPR